MSEDLKMIPELPQPLPALVDKINSGAFQRGPERYGLITGRLSNGKKYNTERTQGTIEAASDVNLGEGVLIITRPAEDVINETVVKIGDGVEIADYVTIQAAAVSDRPHDTAADLVIGNSVVLEEGTEIYNRNFHPLPENKEEVRRFTAIGNNVRVGKFSIILAGSKVREDIPPFSIVTTDKAGNTIVIPDMQRFAEKHEHFFRKLKAGEPAVKLMPVAPVGATEYGTTFSVAGNEAKISLGKCNFVPNGPLLATEGDGSITIGGGGKTTFINRRAQLWALDYPITVEDGAQIAWDTLITTTLEGKHGAVTIGRNSWIGSNAIIYPGISIGEGSIVAAGAIVTENVPDHVLVAGRPAIIKRNLTTTSAMRGKEARFD